MFKIGSYVVYGKEGVCRVYDIGPSPVEGVDKTRQYYTLRPVYREGTIYIPVDSDVKIRPIVTQSEALALIDRINDIVPDTFHNSNPRITYQHYQELMMNHSGENLVFIIKSVYHKKNSLPPKKKLGQIDEKYCKLAEDMLYGELAISLDKTKEEIQSAFEQAVMNAFTKAE